MKEKYYKIYCWTAIWKTKRNHFYEGDWGGKTHKASQRGISAMHSGVCRGRLFFCMCKSDFSVMWSVGLRVFKTFIQYYNQSNKRYQVGNIGQFCSTLHHVCVGSIFSDLWAQFGDFRQERLGWDSEGLCAYEDR